MIKAIPDTNILLRGMFGYKSAHRKLISLAALKKIQLYGCAETYKEFCEKAFMEEIQKYWTKKHFSPEKVILDYKSVVMMHEPLNQYRDAEIPIQDADDAIFFRIAMSAGIRLVISEDIKHVQKLNGFSGIKVISAQQFIDAYTEIKGSLGLASITPQ